MKPLRYALISTKWGVAAAVCTRRGLTAFIWPQTSADRARRHVRRVAPAAAPVEAGRLPRGLAGRVSGYFAGRRVSLADVPVDLSGQPPFRARVLRALQKVGYGRTISYGQLAARVGRPRAARAVGRAVGANPVPVIVPCHRVLRGDGGLGGFSAEGGLPLKRRLLAMEREAASGG